MSPLTHPDQVASAVERHVGSVRTPASRERWLEACGAA
jgi:hypothetical protein